MIRPPAALAAGRLRAASARAAVSVVSQGGGGDGTTIQGGHGGSCLQIIP